ncbi:MAG TPA: STAS domain-containing protein [Pyrinomonadaceae bacterium]
MTTRITRIEGERMNQMILKLEGALTIADARLLEEICTDLQDELRCAITIDLSGVNFLGSQSAEILCRLKSMPDLEIEGAHLFVQQIIDSVENRRNGGPHE